MPTAETLPALVTAALTASLLTLTVLLAQPVSVPVWPRPAVVEVTR